MKNVEDIIPLSPMQQGMLFQALFDPQARVYFEQFTCKLHGALDPELFRQAWQRAVDNHQMLRTGFVWEGLDEPLQVIREKVELPWEVLDWRAYTAHQRQALLEAYLAEDRQRGFKLTKAPLLRVALMLSGEDEHQLVFSFDHLLLDGWSLPIVLKDVFAHYHALSCRQEIKSAPLRPYSDYIGWLKRQDQPAAEQYWRRTLGGFNAPTPLTVDRTADGEQQYETVFTDLLTSLSVAATARLQAFAREHKLTLNSIVQALWGLLLSRYSGHPEVVFGAVVSGRPPELEGVERMVGMFINTLPVKVRVDEEREVLEWIRELQGEQAEARQYEYSALAEVQGWSGVARGLPLFESVLSYQNYPVESAIGGQGRALHIDAVRPQQQPIYPLNLKIMPGQALAVRFVYERQRFEAAIVEQMAAHLLRLMENIVAHAARPLRELSLLSETEQARLIYGLNETAQTEAQAQCIHHLFEAQSERTPDAVAIVTEDEQLTYAELNRRANRQAHYLQAMGVGAETLVGLCLKQPLDMVVCILAVLKAGGAYLPIDPEYPLERLKWMIEDSEASIIITQEELSGNLPTTWAQVVWLDEERAQIASLSAENPAATVEVENLAYVIYTSGSTGNPKGVLLTHRGIGNLASAQGQGFAIDSTSNVLKFASFSFDASVAELFSTLLNGACLHLAQAESLFVGSALVETLRERAIDNVTLPPSLLALMSDEFPALRTVISAGESCTREIIEKWSAGRRFVNAYGPTETTVCASLFVNGGARRSSLIGRPICNTHMYIVDEVLRPQPLGVKGELLIGGLGLARGYQHRADLTAEKFIPDPFSTEPGARLYRTGDVARYLPDGQIEFLGRADQQVKLRGFRIEPGEIEAALREHSAVLDCAVCVREDEPGEKRIVAYFISEPGETVSLSEMRSHLKTSLPEYMIPAAIVQLEQWPLLPNGKVDRKALPAPDSARPEVDNAYLAPRTPTETALAQIWARTLKLERIGVADDFFDLGGHSLLATQFISLAKESFGVDLPLRALFENPTIAQMSVLIDSMCGEEVTGYGLSETDAISRARQSSVTVALQAQGPGAALFCVHPAGGNVLCYRELAQQIGSSRPLYGFQSLGLAQPEQSHESVEEMAACYADALLEVQSSGPYFLAGWSMGAVVAYEMAQQLTARGEHVAMLNLIDSRAPLDKSALPAEDDALVASFALDLALTWLRDDFDWPLFESLPAADKLGYVLEQARRANIISAEFADEEIERRLQVFKANVRALRSYEPQPYGGNVALFHAADSLAGAERDTSKGWGSLVAGSLQQHVIPGNHYTILRKPQVSLLAGAIEDELTPGTEMELAASVS